MTRDVVQGPTFSVPEATAVAIAARLHTEHTDEIALPSSLYKDGDPSTEVILRHLENLVQASPASFLERYGRFLTVAERHSFQSLRGDYEVDYRLTNLEKTTSMVDCKRLPPAVKNRRHAYMQQLLDAGDFFSMDSMRQRAPLLYHDYLGQFEQAGFHIPTTDRLAESLLRQHDEVQHASRLQVEMDREQDQFSESETSDSEDEAHLQGQPPTQADQTARPSGPLAAPQQPGEGHSAGPCGDSAPSTSQVPVADVDLVTRERRFVEEMKTRFLTGQDAEHINYHDIDCNPILDDHWLEQMARDAEDKYFDED